MTDRNTVARLRARLREYEQREQADDEDRERAVDMLRSLLLERLERLHAIARAEAGFVEPPPMTPERHAELRQILASVAAEQHARDRAATIDPGWLRTQPAWVQRHWRGMQAVAR